MKNFVEQNPLKFRGFI